MSTMNVSLPESLKEFVDEQVSRGGYGTSSEYVRELISRDSDRLQVFYVERMHHIDVWRVLHGQRDIPAWMHEPDMV